MSRLTALVKLLLLVLGGLLITAETGFRWPMWPATCVGMALAYLLLRKAGVRRIDAGMAGALAANYLFFFWVHALVVKIETSWG